MGGRLTTMFGCKCNRPGGMPQDAAVFNPAACRPGMLGCNCSVMLHPIWHIPQTQPSSLPEPLSRRQCGQPSASLKRWMGSGDASYQWSLCESSVLLPAPAAIAVDPHCLWCCRFFCMSFINTILDR